MSEEEMSTREKINRINQITTAMQHLYYVVDEVGDDFIYRPHKSYLLEGQYSCLYVYEGRPDCLVGKILHRMGIPLEILSQHEGMPASSVCNYVRNCNDSIANGNQETRTTPSISEEVQSILEVAQYYQDGGARYARVRSYSEDRAMREIENVFGS
jgi:hypothetical protein